MHSRNKFALRVLVLSAILFAANTAYAGDTGSVATMDEPTHIMSLSISASDLLRFSSHAGFDPFLGFGAEFKATEQWGFMLMGGYGPTSAKSEIIGTQDFMAWQAGGQLRYYLLGDFDHGMQIGGEVLYVNVLRDEGEGLKGKNSLVTDGLGIAPFVGYKLATKVGFTFGAQLGIQRTFALAEAESTDNVNIDRSDASAWGPLLNLNVGWSF